jgi:hypothetical protein
MPEENRGSGIPTIPQDEWDAGLAPESVAGEDAARGRTASHPCGDASGPGDLPDTDVQREEPDGIEPKHMPGNAKEIEIAERGNTTGPSG